MPKAIFCVECYFVGRITKSGSCKLHDDVVEGVVVGGVVEPLGVIEPQPPPKPNGNAAVWDLVKKDIEDRDQFGLKKYGVRLQAGNGRDFLTDAYQKALDLVVYLRGAIEERNNASAISKQLEAGQVVRALPASAGNGE